MSEEAGYSQHTDFVTMILCQSVFPLVAYLLLRTEGI